MRPLSEWTRTLPDGRTISLIPLTFGRARLVIGRGTETYDDGW